MFEKLKKKIPYIYIDGHMHFANKKTIYTYHEQ